MRLCNRLHLMFGIWSFLVHLFLKLFCFFCLGTPPLAVHEIEPQLQKLKKKAVSRVREFLLQKIHSLKKPRTNLQVRKKNGHKQNYLFIFVVLFLFFQVIQHNVLSRFKYMNVFLQAHEPPIYDEIQVFYVDTMSKVRN